MKIFFVVFDKLFLPLLDYFLAIVCLKHAIDVLTHSQSISHESAWMQSTWVVAINIVAALFFTLRACGKWNFFVSNSKS